MQVLIKPDHVLIQECFDRWDFFNGIRIARNFLESHPESQPEILLLAKGLFVTRKFVEANFWLTKTNVSSDLKEKITSSLKNCGS